jgi:conjugal transfer pilus assembly protein TraW
MRRAVSVLALGAVLVATTATAKDLGTLGATFPIVEKDLAAKLKAAQASGKIDDLNRKFASRAKARIERPNPVEGITHTLEPRSWLFDPTIEVPQDYADQNGQVFAHKGDRINPLERIPGFNRVLVFVDGDAADQVEFAIRRAKRHPDRERVYIVLTSGAPLELMRKEKVEMFFDQSGLLTSHFNIQHVPAVVEKDGLALRVSELKP